MASVTDYGNTNAPLSAPPLGGPGGWAEAVSAVVDNDDTTVNARVAAHAANPDPHAQYLLPTEVLAGNNVTVDTATTPGSVIVSATGGGTGDSWGRWTGTQSEYDALGVYDPNILYVVIG
jgi:hypothetical protein